MAQADAGEMTDLMQDASGQMVTADGVPLKLSLKRAERQRKLMALASGLAGCCFSFSSSSSSPLVR